MFFRVRKAWGSLLKPIWLTNSYVASYPLLACFLWSQVFNPHSFPLQAFTTHVSNLLQNWGIFIFLLAVLRSKRTGLLYLKNLLLNTVKKQRYKNNKHGQKSALSNLIQSSQCLFMVYSPTLDFSDATAEASGAGSLLMIFEACPSRLNVRSSCSIVALERCGLTPFQCLARVSVFFRTCVPVFLPTQFICSALCQRPLWDWFLIFLAILAALANALISLEDSPS